jgi:hypothetical protein
VTYMTCWLEIRTRGNKEKRFMHKLPEPRSGRLGPYDLRYWAKEEGLEIEYIDNCYVKVPVGSDKLLAFLSDLFSPGDPYTASALPTLAPEWEFVLAAEEF